MEHKLNIYKTQREVEKTYTANDYDIMLGPVEDLLNALDLEALINTEDKDGMLAAASSLLNTRKDVIYPLLMDVFDGLTEAELRRTKVKEVLAVIVGLAGFRLESLPWFAGISKR